MKYSIFAFLFIFISCASNPYSFIACPHEDSRGYGCSIVSRNGELLYKADENTSLYRSGESFRVESLSDQSWKLLNNKGEVIFFNPDFTYIGPVGNRHQSYRIKGKEGDLFGFFSIDPVKIVPAIHHRVEVFSEGLAAVKKVDWQVPMNIRTGYLNLNNELEIDFKIIGYGYPFHDGAAIFSTYNQAKTYSSGDNNILYHEQMGIIDRSGNIIIEPCDYRIRWLGDKRWLIDYRNESDLEQSNCKFKQDTIVDLKGQAVGNFAHSLEFEKALDKKHLLFYPAGPDEPFQNVVVDKMTSKILRTFQDISSIQVGKIANPSVLASSSSYYIYDVTHHLISRSNPYKYLKQIAPNRFLASDQGENDYVYGLIDSTGRPMISFLESELYIERGFDHVEDPKSDQIFDNDWEKINLKRVIKTNGVVKILWYDINGKLLYQKKL